MSSEGWFVLVMVLVGLCVLLGAGLVLACAWDRTPRRRHRRRVGVRRG